MSISANRTTPKQSRSAPTPATISRLPLRPHSVAITVVAAWQTLLCLVVGWATVALWPSIDTTVADQPTQVLVLGATLTMTAMSGALVMGALGGMAGCLVHTVPIFCSRVGRQTFEPTFVYWYVLRPLTSAMLALLTVAALHGGLFALSTSTDPSAAAAYALGGVAGLFTDSVVQKLRGVLGATSTEHPATTQSVPLAPRASVTGTRS